jgi:hypothetical protein
MCLQISYQKKYEGKKIFFASLKFKITEERSWIRIR